MAELTLDSSVPGPGLSPLGTPTRPVQPLGRGHRRAFRCREQLLSWAVPWAW